MRMPVISMGSNAYVGAHMERIDAHRKHDGEGQSLERAEWDDRRWLWVLMKEVGEVASAHDERVYIDPHLTTREQMKKHIREELIQVIAMAAAWVDAIDQSRV